MKRICISLVLALSLNFPLSSSADDIAADDMRETTGFGIGALIGGLIAGPPGAILGAASGAITGIKDAEKDRKLARLEKKLQDKSIQLAYLQQQFDKVRARHEEHLQRVRQSNRREQVQDISDGFSFSVYFRTGRSDIDPTLLPHIRDLAGLVQGLPDIKVMLEAHADKRGNKAYNRKLSEARADAVQSILIKAGLDGNRIRTHAYGESRARVVDSDLEGLVFDRRVDIHLTTETEA